MILLTHPSTPYPINQAALDAGSHTPDSFKDDMRLIFDNCMKYNLEESELYVWARDLQNFFEEQYNLHVHAEIVLEAKRQVHLLFPMDYICSTPSLSLFHKPRCVYSN